MKPAPDGAGWRAGRSDAGQILPIFAIFLLFFTTFAIVLILQVGQLGYVIRHGQGAVDLGVQAGAVAWRTGASPADAAQTANTMAREYVAWNLDDVAGLLGIATSGLPPLSFDGTPPAATAQAVAYDRTRVWVVDVEDGVCQGAWYFAPTHWDDAGVVQPACDDLTDFPADAWTLPPTTPTVYLETELPTQFLFGTSRTYRRWSAAPATVSP